MTHADSSTVASSADTVAKTPPPPEVHDAFAYLLEEIDHEDLARSMRVAHTAADTTAASDPAAMLASTRDAVRQIEQQHYHLLSTDAAADAAVVAPAERYIESDEFHAIASHLLPSPSTPTDTDTLYVLPVAPHGAASPLAAPVDAEEDDDVTTPTASPTANDNNSYTPPPTAATTATVDSSVTNSTDDEKSASPPAAPSATTSTTTTKRKAPPMENSTRKRQKEELAYLREKVLSLESELGAMQDRARVVASSTTPPDAATDAASTASTAAASKPETRVTTMSLWERVAKRQLVEKQKAELKNLKLKTALEDQLKIAKSLEKVLRKRPSATLSTQVLDSVQVVNSKRFCSLSRSDARIYDMLLANAERVYQEVDNVYARNEFFQTDASIDVNDTKLKVDESNQLFMEITHAKVIPFDLQTTIDGVWQCLSLAQVPISDGVYEAVERTRDTICAKTTMSLHVHNTETTVRTRFVMKRFDEPDRVILACESTTHSEGPREVVHGIKVLEKGWIVIKPAKEGGGTSIQLCIRMTPTISGDVLEHQRRHTGAITDMILGSVNKSLGVMYQTVENILMETVKAGAAVGAASGGVNAAAIAAATAAAKAAAANAAAAVTP